jgi:diguanylate cyclase (GGDEF)-like protein
MLVATNGVEAIQKAEHHLPDCILLDIRMPLVTGRQVCQALQGDEATRYIPVIFLSGLSADDDIIEALDGGANDYIVKPFNPKVVMARVRVALRMKKFQEELRSKHQIAEVKANTDELTGLNNRRLLFDRLREETNRASRFGYGLTVIMVDIDHFKDINDTRGHQVGDRVLSEVASILKFSTRAYDVICRYGGDEFTLILPQTDRDQGLVVAERIRYSIAMGNFPTDSGRLEVTASLGMSSFPEDGDDPDILLQAADLALYHAKQAGRNQVQYMAR